MAAKPFSGEEWVCEGGSDTFRRAGVGDSWTFNQERELWRWACADNQWEVILGAVPETQLALADLDVARAEYNEAASDNLAQVFFHRARFAKGSPVGVWRKRRKNIQAAMLDEVQAKKLPYQYHLSQALEFADAAVAAFEMQGHAHKGRKSPERSWLYCRLLNIWTTRFNGKLTTGRPSNEKPGKRVANSPALRFLLAALGPVLRDDMIGAEAAEKIIKAEMRRRKRSPENVESWVKGLRALKKRTQ
jgi:hypothetical protein